MSEPQSEWLSERQKEAVSKLSNAVKEYHGGIAWWKIGEGKTRLGISTYLQSVPYVSNPNCLVICSPKAMRQWDDEVGLHRNSHIIKPRFKYLSTGHLQKLTNIKNVSEIIVRYEIGFVILDELWLYKNTRTRRSLAVYNFFRCGITVIGLSGSLITARNIEDIFGQSHACGISRILAKSLTDFRSQFCVCIEEYGLTYWAKQGAIETIQQRLAPCVDVYFPKDTRETRIQHVKINPYPAQAKAINELKKEYYTRIDEQPLEIKYATTLLIRLQQISDGFANLSQRQRVRIKSAKCDRLLELLAEYSDAGERVVVWFAFKESIEIISERLGEKAALLSSDHDFDAKGWAVGKYRACLATMGSGFSLNDFKDCQYAIIYSAPFSPLLLQQAMGRTNRTGSQHQICHYQFLSTDDSIDKSVYDNLLMSGEIEKANIRTSMQVLEEYFNGRD
jgi:SNF2 family DNA or RNA helicase